MPFAPRALHGVLLVCLVAAGAGSAVYLGPDANWDFRNYHYYNAYALMEWRYDADLWVAGLQTYFNPLPDLPYYLLSRTFGLTAAAALQGAIFGVYAWIVWRINFLVFSTLPGFAGDPGRWSPAVTALLATALGVTAAATVSEIGTTFNDIQTGALVLAALLLVLVDPDRRPRPRAMAGAGALLGIAAGLKLTAAIFAPGLVLAVVIVRGARSGLRPAVLLCLGWAAGFLVANGWWAALLYSRFENPVFPLFNGIFRSPWVPPVDAIDDRFFPQGFGEWLAYPFNWALDVSIMDVAEVPFRDPRLALALVALLVLAGMAAAGMRLGPRLVLVVWFGVIGYVVWIRTFAILRYAVPLEAIAATLIAAVIALGASRLRPGRPAASPLVLAIVLAAVVAVTMPPDWWRMAQGANRIKVADRRLPDRSLVVVAGVPLGVAVPFLRGRDLEFLGISDDRSRAVGYRLNAEIAGRIARHDGPRLVLFYEGMDLDHLERFGVAADRTRCRAMEINIPAAEGPLTRCALIPVDFGP